MTFDCPLLVIGAGNLVGLMQQTVISQVISVGKVLVLRRLIHVGTQGCHTERTGPRQHLATGSGGFKTTGFGCASGCRPVAWCLCVGAVGAGAKCGVCPVLRTLLYFSGEEWLVLYCGRGKWAGVDTPATAPPGMNLW